MTTMQHVGPVRETGGDRGIVLAVLPGGAPEPQVLRYAALVAAVDGRALRVLVPRSRYGLTTDAALVAARRRTRSRVAQVVGGWRGAPVDVDEMVVRRAVMRDPVALWDAVARAARARHAAVLVVPPDLGREAPPDLPGVTVTTVSGRPASMSSAAGGAR